MISLDHACHQLLTLHSTLNTFFLSASCVPGIILRSEDSFFTFPQNVPSQAEKLLCFTIIS